MYDLGASDGHANYHGWADNANWDAFTTYSTFAWVKRDAAGVPAAFRSIWGKHTAAIGWTPSVNTAWKPAMAHDNVFASVSTTALTNGSTQSVGFIWTGTGVNYYLDGAANGSDGTFATAITGNSVALEIGHSGLRLGAVIDIGHVAVWRNYQLTADEIALYHGGAAMPNMTNLIFWCRCTVEPGLDEVAGASSSETGSVAMVDNVVDTYYQGSSGWQLFVSGILGPMFLPVVYGIGHQIGANLRSESPAKLRQLASVLNGRCTLDWSERELRHLCALYDRRPVFA